MKNYKSKSLTELIYAAQNDDHKALEEIVKRHQARIYEIFFKLNPSSDLSDLTQETLLKMTKSIKNLRNPERFNSWLYQIAQNIFYDTLRKNSRHSSVNTSDPILSGKDGEFGPCIIDQKKTPDENSLSCELKMKITKAIEELPELFRTIILLREIDGLSYEEIAELTDLNINTVKTRIARARIKLKKELEPYINNRS